MHKRKCATSWLMAKLDHRFPTHQRRTWLAADVGQFPAGAALDEQRHEVSEGSAVEPRVIVVDNRRDGVRRNVWIALLEAIHHVLNSRPFACLDHQQMFAPRSWSVKRARCSRPSVYKAPTFA
jgi:hypothetical protein